MRQYSGFSIQSLWGKLDDIHLPAKKTVSPLVIFPLIIILGFALLLSGCRSPQISQEEIQIAVNADGQNLQVNIPAGSDVEEALIISGIEIEEADRVNPPLYTLLADGEEIQITRVREEFESKEEIFSAIVRARHPYKRILPIALAAEGDDIETFAHNTGRAIVRELSENSDYVNLLFIEILEFKGKHMAEIFQDIFPQVLPLLERFQAGNPREFPPMMLMRIFIGTFISYYLTEISFGEVAMPNMQEDAMQHFVDVFLHGVLEVEK